LSRSPSFDETKPILDKDREIRIVATKNSLCSLEQYRDGSIFGYPKSEKAEKPKQKKVEKAVKFDLFTTNET
jgi:hypothetical protein